MKRFSISLSLALMLTGWLAYVAEACCCKMPAQVQSPIQQAIQADVVVFGKVIGLEPDLLSVEQYPGSGKVGHMIAVVQIEEALLGAKGITHLRIAYVPTAQPMQQDEFGFIQQQAQQERFWRGPANLLEGQEACFFLQKHATNDFYMTLNMGYPLEKTELAYDDQLKAVRKVLRAVENPVEALQAKEASDRQMIACALVLKYKSARNNGGQALPPVAIPADESKLIVKALGEMKWGETPFDQRGVFSLQSIFWQLQLTDKDGWTQPEQKENEDYNTVMSDAIAKWAKNHGDKHRIQRLVFAAANANTN